METPNNYKKTIAEELASFSNSKAFNYTSLFDKLYGYSSSDYSNDYYGFEAFIREQSNLYFNKAIIEYKKTKSIELKNKLNNIALRQFNERYDILIRLDDYEYFKLVLDKAKDFLKGEDFLFDQDDFGRSEAALFSLPQAFYNPNFKEEVTVFFNEAFNYSKTYALEHKEYDYLSGEPDGDTLLVLAQAISALNKKEREHFASLVFDIYTFCSLKERDYNVNQASGYIALLLPKFSKKIDIEILNNAIEVTGKHYQKNTFVHQTLYSKWLLSNDCESALAYLKLEENKKGFIYACIALADLNCKTALPLFESMLKEAEDPVFIEVLIEAIKRLKNQDSIVDIEDRMIWLNGNLTPTQRALGANSDNIFVKRAQEKVALDDTVYETDDD